MTLDVMVYLYDGINNHKGDEMSEHKVQIVSLPPMRVASFHAYCTEPELEAWKKMETWAKPKGYLKAPRTHRIFGFDTTSETEATPNRGYEFWIEAGPADRSGNDMEIKDFAGGLYAVLFCEVKKKPYETIPAAWKELVAWRESSQYQQACHQWLEEHLDVKDHDEEDFDLNLFLPVAK